LGKIFVGVLIIANLANFDEGGKTGLEGGKNIDPFLIFLTHFVFFKISNIYILRNILFF
jgi:hypothetical protein